MNDGNLFRWILLAGFVLVFPFGVYHRFKAHTGEKLDRRQEGWLILLTLRPIGIAGMLGMIAYLINPNWMAWASVPLPVSLRWAGVALGVMVDGLLFWTFRTLGKNLTDTVVTRKEATLVTNGPYRWVRHPFYVSVALAVLATALTTANWFIFATGCPVFALMSIRTRKEEANLIARFGDDYRKYMERTGRFVPKFR